MSNSIQITRAFRSAARYHTAAVCNRSSLAVLTSFLLLLLLLASVACVQAYSDSTIAKPGSTLYTSPLVFNITTPSSLAGSVAFAPASGGSVLPVSNRPDGTIDMAVMLPHPLDDVNACGQPWRTTNEFNQSFAGAWVMLQYSRCSYSNFYFASFSGAAGILIYDCPTAAPYSCDGLVKEALVFVAPTTAVPLIAIGSADGQKIINYLQSLKATSVTPSRNAVVIRLQSTGNIIPQERAALIAIMQQSTMLGLGSGTILETLPMWSAAHFSNPAVDPCRNRTVGIWCENGSVVYISVWYHGFSNTGATLPKEFGSLTKLRYLSLEQNNLQGKIPDEWCNLTQLKSLLLSQNAGIPSIPDCIGNWQALEELSFLGIQLKALPAAIGTLANLKWLNLQQNGFTSLPDLSGLVNLQVINVGGNGIKGSFPAFHPQAPLSQIGLAYNQFIGSIPASLSSYYDTLLVLDCNHNFFSGALPALNGFTKLRVLDFSSQRGSPIDSTLVGFAGSMPQGWANLINLQKLYLQENSFTGPFLLNNMPSLQYLDLSNNKLTSATVANPNNDDVGLLMYDLASPAIISVKLSKNNITGPLTTGTYILLSTFNQLFIDHNQITSLPRELLLGGFRSIDASYNNVQNTPNFPAPPAIDFLLLDVRGNPMYRLGSSQSLPDWMVVSETRVQQKNETFFCSTLTSTTAPQMIINVDPTFYSYRYCDCQSGYFGKAPLCALVPDSATLSPTKVIESVALGSSFPELITDAAGLGGDLYEMGTNASSVIPQYSKALSDSMYGDTNRLTVGMSTSWVFDLSDLYSEDLRAMSQQGLTLAGGRSVYQSNDSALVSSLWTSVRWIIVRLHLNQDQFNSFEDQLAVYEGGSDLLGSRVMLLRGTSDKRTVTYSEFASSEDYLARYNASLIQLGSNTSLIEVRVFSPIATLQFISRSDSGTHFYATYSYGFDCPNGYFYDNAKTPAQCRLNRSLFRVGDGIQAAVWAVCAVAIIFVIINLIIMWRFWDYPVYKAASRIFMLLTLIFLLCMSLGALMYAAVPSAGTRWGEVICNGRAWLSCLPLAGILGIILAKSNRLNSIFGSTTLQVKAMTDAQIARIVLTVCLLQVGLLTVFTGLPLSRPIRTVGKGSLSDELVDSCSQETGFMSWISAEIAYIGCLMLPAAYLGFKTRDLPSQFNESAHIQNALVLLIFFGAIIVPLDIFIQDNPEAAVLIQGLGQAFLTMILAAIIFLPKMYYLLVFKTILKANNNSNKDQSPQKSVHTRVSLPPSSGTPAAAAAIRNLKGKSHTSGRSQSLISPPYPISIFPRAGLMKKDGALSPSVTTTQRRSTDFTGAMTKTVPLTITRSATPNPPPTQPTTAAASPSTNPYLALGEEVVPEPPPSARRKIRLHAIGGSALQEIVLSCSSSNSSNILIAQQPAVVVELPLSPEEVMQLQQQEEQSGSIDDATIIDNP